MLIYSLLVEELDSKLRVYNCDNVDSAKETYEYIRKAGVKKVFLMRSEIKEFKKEVASCWDYAIKHFDGLDAIIYKVLKTA